MSDFMKKIKIGFMGALHPNMPGDDHGIYSSIVEKMRLLSNDLDFDICIFSRPLRNEKDAAESVDFMNTNAVDFTLLITTSLGNGRVMIPMIKLKSYLGLWAIPETQLSGVLQINSFCGLNMFSAIWSKYWRHYNKPVKWFYDYPDTKLFMERFGVTIRSIRAVKAVKEARIGVVGDVADGFENFIFDERELEAKIGTYVYRRHSVPDIVRIAEAISEADVNKYIKEILCDGKLADRLSKTDMDKFARVNLSFERFSEENDYNALAINCWPTFQQYYNIAVCAVLGRLNYKGIVATCEADVPGAINMIMLNAISGDKSALMDLVSLDEKDNSVNLWHCGPAPMNFADKDGVKWDNHFNIGSYCDEKWCGKGVVGDMKFKSGNITIARTSVFFDDMLIMNAEVDENKNRFEGSSGWVKNIKISGKSVDIKSFIETIVTNRVDHHFPVVYGNFENELYETSAWLHMRVLEPYEYKPYMRLYNFMHNYK